MAYTVKHNTLTSELGGGVKVGATHWDEDHELTGTADTANITDNAITNAKLRDSAALSVIGNGTNATADPADIAAGTDANILRRSGTTVGFGSIDLAAAGAVGTTRLTAANLFQGSALSLVGVTGNATANVASIAAGADFNIMRRSGTAIAFGSIDLSQSGAVGTSRLTAANFIQGSALSVMGVTGNATANIASIAAGADGAVLRRSGTALAFGTIATAGIADNAVTLAKLATVSTATFLGRTTAATGNVEALTATQATALLDAFTSSAKGLVPASGGGTTNFLRADGTWAAAGGSTLPPAVAWNAVTTGGGSPVVVPGYWYNGTGATRTVTVGYRVVAGSVDILKSTSAAPSTFTSVASGLSGTGTQTSISVEAGAYIRMDASSGGNSFGYTVATA